MKYKKLSEMWEEVRQSLPATCTPSDIEIGRRFFYRGAQELFIEQDRLADEASDEEGMEVLEAWSMELQAFMDGKGPNEQSTH